MDNFFTKLEAFSALLEADQLRGIIANHVDCESNRANCKCSIVPGKKYTKVNVGSSGKYMVVNATGEIYGIKGYGVIHRGHFYGTLDTINEWNWEQFHAFKRQQQAA